MVLPCLENPWFEKTGLVYEQGNNKCQEALLEVCALFPKPKTFLQATKIEYIVTIK